MNSRLSLLLAGQNIRVTSINDGNYRAVEKLTACSTKLSVVTTVMMHLSFGKHGKVLHLGLAQWWAVRCNEHHLRLARTQAFQSGFVSEDSLS